MEVCFVAQFGEQIKVLEPDAGAFGVWSHTVTTLKTREHSAPTKRCQVYAQINTPPQLMLASRWS